MARELRSRLDIGRHSSKAVFDSVAARPRVSCSPEDTSDLLLPCGRNFEGAPFQSRPRLSHDRATRHPSGLSVTPLIPLQEASRDPCLRAKQPAVDSCLVHHSSVVAFVPRATLPCRVDGLPPYQARRRRACCTIVFVIGRGLRHCRPSGASLLTLSVRYSPLRTPRRHFRISPRLELCFGSIPQKFDSAISFGVSRLSSEGRRFGAQSGSASDFRRPVSRLRRRQRLVFSVWAFLYRKSLHCRSGYRSLVSCIPQVSRGPAFRFS